MSYGKKTALDRYLSPIDTWAMAFGCAIGWGAFVMLGTTFLPAAGPAGTVIALAAGMAVIAMIGVSFSWLMKRSGGTGGVYSYTKAALEAGMNAHIAKPVDVEKLRHTLSAIFEE